MLVSKNAKHHQIAYVTNDMDKAMAILAEDYGIVSFFPLADGQHDSPVAEGLRMKIGLAIVNGVEIEVIQPIGGPVAIYRDALPSDGTFALVLHHTCIRIEGPIENWNAHRASLDEAKHPIVFQGELGDDLRFIYTDERGRLGHYLEHVWMSPHILDVMAKSIPVHPA